MSELVAFDRVWKKFPRSHAARHRYARRLFIEKLMGRQAEDALRAGEHWSLKDVSLRINRGEAMGVIGRNGAGKSTLLNLIAGHLEADKGRTQVSGSVSSFINLSSGLNGTMSGVENIYFKSALEGRTKLEVDRDIDAIVEFSGLGDRVRDPVGTFSSGMKLRLAFSVAVHSQPDVLLVDEVLAVGDFDFRQKCLRKIEELKEDSAFVLVSHSMAQVTRFCDRCAVLDGGELKFIGEVEKAIEIYELDAAGSLQSVGMSEEPEYYSEDDLEWAEFELDGADSGVLDVQPQDSVTIRGRVKFRRDLADIRIGIPFRTMYGEMVTAVSSEQIGRKSWSVRQGEVVTFDVTFPGLALNPGQYRIVAAIVEGPRFLVRQVVSEIRVAERPMLTWGTFTPNAKWSIAGSASSSDG